jgi:hypothetical protein
VPEDVRGDEATRLADAEVDVKEGPDDEPLAGRLARVGQAIVLGPALMRVEDSELKIPATEGNYGLAGRFVKTERRRFGTPSGHGQTFKSGSLPAFLEDFGRTLRSRTGL